MNTTEKLIELISQMKYFYEQALNEAVHLISEPYAPSFYDEPAGRARAYYSSICILMEQDEKLYYLTDNETEEESND